MVKLHTFRASHNDIASNSHIGIIMYEITLATSAGKILRKSNSKLYEKISDLFNSLKPDIH